jgi:hypothetical protein
MMERYINHDQHERTNPTSHRYYPQLILSIIKATTLSCHLLGGFRCAPYILSSKLAPFERVGFGNCMDYTRCCGKNQSHLPPILSPAHPFHHQSNYAFLSSVPALAETLQPFAPICKFLALLGGFRCAPYILSSKLAPFERVPPPTDTIPSSSFPSSKQLRFLVIGAGSRGNAYAIGDAGDKLELWSFGSRM